MEPGLWPIDPHQVVGQITAASGGLVERPTHQALDARDDAANIHGASKNHTVVAQCAQQAVGARRMRTLKWMPHPRSSTNWRHGVDKQSATSSKSTPTSSRGQKPSTSSDSNRLTKSEVEQLRRNQKEALAYAQKRYFPGARLV